MARRDSQIIAGKSERETGIWEPGEPWNAWAGFLARFWTGAGLSLAEEKLKRRGHAIDASGPTMQDSRFEIVLLWGAPSTTADEEAPGLSHAAQPPR